jgi:2-polyprenyl-3-methyl-5-hydroxy-6-metoxy-1,4-benzoquinol methylase
MSKPVMSGASTKKNERFAFGANWCDFIGVVDESRVTAAVDSLTTSLGTSSLAERSFLDVGCGSGLFSLAAHLLGARVRAFDYDAASVEAATALRDRFAHAGAWGVEQGSVLDDTYAASLGRFDVVYAWGVLHHTGDLWHALRTAADLVAPDGMLFVAIYNDQGLQSRVWRRVKRGYTRSGPLVRYLLIAGGYLYLERRRPLAALARVLRCRAAPARPPRVRGMSARHDLVDWVGGYPFEVARPEQVFAFVHELGFELRHLATCGGGLGCNEYVFERVRAAPDRVGRPSAQRRGAASEQS